MAAKLEADVEAMAKWLYETSWKQHGFSWDTGSEFQRQETYILARALLTNPPDVLRQRCKEMEEGR